MTKAKSKTGTIGLSLERMLKRGENFRQMFLGTDDLINSAVDDTLYDEASAACKAAYKKCEDEGTLLGRKYPHLPQSIVRELKREYGTYVYDNSFDLDSYIDKGEFPKRAFPEDMVDFLFLGYKCSTLTPQEVLELVESEELPLWMWDLYDLAKFGTRYHHRPYDSSYDLMLCDVWFDLEHDEYMATPGNSKYVRWAKCFRDKYGKR